MRVQLVLETIGEALKLQLLFVLSALPLVTALPAAVALQREWARFRSGGKTTAVSFFAAFRTAWRARWLAGLIAPLFCAALAVSYAFWAASTGWPGVVAIGLLLGLGFVALCFWLALLATSDPGDVDGVPTWFRAAGDEFLRHLPRYLLGLAVLIAWFAAAWFSPPLLLVGSGIVPALLAHWAARPGTAVAASGALRRDGRSSRR